MSWRSITLPGGAVVETDGTFDGLDDGGPIRFHPEIAASRAISYWIDKPAFQALLRTYSEEFQQIENLLWDLLVLLFPDYAFGAQLDLQGRLLHVGRNGRGDAAYKARLKVQIAIYKSLGRASDVISILRLADPARFRYVQLGGSTYQIMYSEPAVSRGAQAEIPGILRDATALGVGWGLIQPIDAPGVLAGPFAWASAHGGVPAGLGFGSARGGNVGGALSWYAKAEAQ